LASAANRLEVAALAKRVDWDSLRASQPRLVHAQPRARADMLPALQIAAARDPSPDALEAVRASLLRDPDWRRHAREEDLASVSMGFWRGPLNFSFRVTRAANPRGASALHVRMAFRPGAMAWKIVGVELLAPGS